MSEQAEQIEVYEPKRSRLALVPFEQIKPSTTRNYLVKDLVPREGLTVIWGPPKCGKSFWTFDLVMHVALSTAGCDIAIYSDSTSGVAPVKFKLDPSDLINNCIPGDWEAMNWHGCNPLSFATVDRALDIIRQTEWGARNLAKAKANGTTLETKCELQGKGHYRPLENAVQIPVPNHPQNSKAAHEQIAELVRTLLEEVAHATHDEESIRKTSKTQTNLTWLNPNPIKSGRKSCPVAGFVTKEKEQLLRKEALGQLQAALLAWNLNRKEPLKKRHGFRQPNQAGEPLFGTRQDSRGQSLDAFIIPVMFKGTVPEFKFTLEWPAIDNLVQQGNWPEAVDKFVEFVKLETAGKYGSTYYTYNDYFELWAKTLLRCPTSELKPTDNNGWICACYNVDPSKNLRTCTSPLRNCPQ